MIKITRTAEEIKREKIKLEPYKKEANYCPNCQGNQVFVNPVYSLVNDLLYRSKCNSCGVEWEVYTNDNEYLKSDNPVTFQPIQNYESLPKHNCNVNQSVKSHWGGF